MLQPKSDQFPVLFEGTDRDPVLFCPAPDGRWIRLLPHKLTGSSAPPSYSLSLIFHLSLIFSPSYCLSLLFPSLIFSLPHVLSSSYSLLDPDVQLSMATMMNISNMITISTMMSE